MRRNRPSARLIVREPEGRVLLFRFEFRLKSGVKQNFWATPGVAVDDGETFEQAAKRELLEETGFDLPLGKEILRRESEFTTPDNIPVLALERYYLVESGWFEPENRNWTDLERSIMKEWRWWSAEELSQTEHVVWPADLAELLLTI